MALGAALATGKPQAYTVVPGPGLLNSSAGLLTAYGTNAPVLALIGHIAEDAVGRGFGHLHEIRDQEGILSAACRFYRPHPHALRRRQRLVDAAVPRDAEQQAGAGRRSNAPSTCGDAAGRSRGRPACHANTSPLDENAIVRGGPATRRRQSACSSSAAAARRTRPPR